MKLKVIEADSATELESKFNAFCAEKDVIVREYSFQQATQPELSYVAFINYITYSLDLEGESNDERI